MHRNRHGKAAMTPPASKPALFASQNSRQRVDDNRPNVVPLRDVLSRAADEARHVHGGLAGLDACLGGALGRLPPDVLAILQKTDLLRQEAEGLALFLHHLATDILQAQTCDPARALESLLLQEQHSRLSGQSAEAAPEPETEIWSSDPAPGGG